MDTEKQYTKKCKPEIGRGCSFCDCGAECEAKLCDGCFKLHETAWLEEYPENIPTDIVEVRFKNTRRSFYLNANNLQLKRGDIVAVEASPGHDIGVVSLTGDLVARQMRRTGFNPYNGEFKKVYRKAKPYDIEKWQEAIALEHETMIASRQIAADMGLNMKIGDVEYQGDKIKAIFYYIADERVDFRELIKVFAERFHIRIEMKHERKSVIPKKDYSARRLIDTLDEKFQNSPGLQQWATIENLKIAAQSYNEVGSLSDLKHQITVKTEARKSAKQSVVKLEHHMKDLAEIIKYAEQYKTNRSYHIAYKKSKNPDAYFRRYESQLILYGGARRVLEQTGINLKGLNVDKLKAEYQELMKQKNELTSTYKNCEKEVQSLNRKLENLNQYLGQTQPDFTSEQSRKKNNPIL